MNKYKISIEGKNCFVSIDSKPTRSGFFATRFIEASEKSEASKLALQLINIQLQDVILNKNYSEIKLIVDSVEQIDFYDNMLIPGEGFSWYVDEDNSLVKKVLSWFTDTGVRH